MKVSFLCNLWSWANLYSVDNTDSLVDFLSRLGYWGFFFGSLLYTSGVRFGSFLLFFLSIYCFLPIKKKEQTKRAAHENLKKKRQKKKQGKNYSSTLPKSDFTIHFFPLIIYLARNGVFNNSNESSISIQSVCFLTFS